jgi:putative ABC transport system permease protein
VYFSLREIAFAKGRFALIGGVVALITVLLVLLTGLTNGLSHQNTSALKRLDAERIIFSAPADDSGRSSFTESGITADQLATWQDNVGAGSVERLGVAQSRAEAAGGGAVGVAVLGLEDDTALAPGLPALHGQSHPGPGQVVLSDTVATDLGVSVGQELKLSSTTLTVAGITADENYSHVPVAWVTMTDFPAIAHLTEGIEATALAIPASTSTPDPATLAAADAVAGTIATDTPGSFAALPAYQSERGSLLMMQGFLYAISALVVVSFLSVWTIQRTREIAVLRALGSSNAYLRRDSLTQAALVLALGVLTGGFAGLGGGLAISSAVPFALDLATIALPVLGVLVLGLLGALLATRRVASIDPLLALGGN